MSHGPGKRLDNYDYASPGWYFVTTVIEARRPLFGTLWESGVQLSPLGLLACEMYEETLRRRPWTSSDAFVVMPDHFHAIVGWSNTPANRTDVTLGHFVAQFKALTTREAKRKRLVRSWEHIWQEGFWDVIVRSQHAHDRLREYVIQNPAKGWRAACDSRS